VLGNLLAAYVLGYFDQRLYVIIISAIGALATALLFFMKNPFVQTSLHNLASRLSMMPIEAQRNSDVQVDSHLFQTAHTHA
jgi:phosphotransferase system  glucose/maltose/N-acetylglucosamine-specific IIC component